MTVALHAHFRGAGWRWPFRLGDGLEVWRDQALVGEISVELLASLVTHYLVGHDLVRQFDAAIVPASASHRPLVTASTTERRARRRARKPAKDRR